MSKLIFVVLLSVFLAFSGFFGFFGGLSQNGLKSNTGTLEKLIVSNGSVELDLDLNRLKGTLNGSKEPTRSKLRFDVERNSLFTIVVFNGELRGPVPGSMALIPQSSAALPVKLSASYKRLVIERASWGERFEFAVRDGKSGFVFFDIEGQQFDYEPNGRLLRIQNGRLLISKQFADELGKPADTGAIVGKISITATMRPIEITEIVDGEVKSDVLPALNSPEGGGTIPGPDVIVGDVFGLAQFGVSGSQVGLAVGTTSCNFGTEDLNWLRLPNNDHPVIPQNLYRMSGGAANDERFEQIGRSNVKHAFTALTQNLCQLGCNGIGGSRLGSGCSDPYSASLNAGPSLGSRAWINPFEGAYPRGDSATPPNSHSGHSHTGSSHRILTEISDLSTASNPGATYYAEGQYITPHEYTWCQANPGECNMYNNVSYRQYSVTGTGSPFSFSPVSSTVRTQSAISAWPGATIVRVEPDPGNDGVAAVAYKVTNPAPGVWHYEYAIYNQNLDRAIQSFSVPLGAGAVVNNVGFHAPPQHPGWAADGTAGDAGYSSTPWTQTQTAASMDWNSETFVQNQNANAIRWGTMYNFRFDSGNPPQAVNATIGFFKTGAPVAVQVMAPNGSFSTVSVSGRVTATGGWGVAKATVFFTDSGGNVRATTSSSFGYYQIDGLTAGETFTIGVFSKKFTFTSQMMQIDNNLTGVDFVADP